MTALLEERHIEAAAPKKECGGEPGHSAADDDCTARFTHAALKCGRILCESDSPSTVNIRSVRDCCARRSVMETRLRRIVCGLVWLWVAGAASAAVDPFYTNLYQRGIAYFRAGDYASAQRDLKIAA